MPLIRPMLAKSGHLPNDQGSYSFEIKWDGIRAMLYLEKNTSCLMSRNLRDITCQYPELADLAASITSKHDELILDGEIVAFDPAGLPSFSRLQHRMGLKDEKVISEIMQQVPAHYMIFDILSLDYSLLLDRPYTERRALLESLALEGTNWQTPGYKTNDGQTILAASRSLGLEGIIAKRLDSLYQAGKRTGAWIKIKNQRRQELVIGGWVPGQGARQGQIGALLVGCYNLSLEAAQAGKVPQQLKYAGKVGTGFTQRTLAELADLLAPLSIEDSPFTHIPAIKRAHFVKPVLVGEFEFTEWTPNHTLRHPSFKGLRYDKDPHQVIRED